MNIVGYNPFYKQCGVRHNDSLCLLEYNSNIFSKRLRKSFCHLEVELQQMENMESV